MRTLKRKKMKNAPIYLKYLHKQKGGRIANLTTFKSVCNPETASVQLIGLRSLKTPEESDDFVHVIKSAIDKSPIVVKVQEPGRMLKMELDIQKRLRNCNNVVNYICDFECLFDNFIWSKPLQTPRTFCDKKGSALHLIVMEYINNDLANYMESESISKEVLCSLVKQAGYALLDFHINCNVSHNDINRGNVLLDVGIPKTLSYTINEYTATVDTMGVEIVFIDFQRGNIHEGADEPLAVQLANDELSLVYELMSKWTHEYKAPLQRLMYDIMETKSLKQLFSIINEFVI